MKPPPPKELSDLKLGFIGWGAMAQALSLGVVRKELTSPENIMVTDMVPEILEIGAKEGLQTSKSNSELVDWADIVVMAVKPQAVEGVLSTIHKQWTQQKLLVSICAGTTIDTYLQGLHHRAKVVRVMPNSSCLVGESASAYAGSKEVAEWELDLVHNIFATVGGATHRVPEHLLNAVTGLSGSGPAYVYMLINALSDAGVHGGLPRSVALSLATQTVLGSAKMVQESGEHPMVLKEGVTSPAGTTIAGVRVLEQRGFNGTIIEAVEAARMRSEQLSQKPDFLYQKRNLNSMDNAP
jgi:pyrroline-5-carboxylate reductase